jgi:hypothetical protein
MTLDAWVAEFSRLTKIREEFEKQQPSSEQESEEK